MLSEKYRKTYPIQQTRFSKLASIFVPVKNQVVTVPGQFAQPCKSSTKIPQNPFILFPFSWLRAWGGERILCVCVCVLFWGHQGRERRGFTDWSLHSRTWRDISNGGVSKRPSSKKIRQMEHQSLLDGAMPKAMKWTGARASPQLLHRQHH